MAISPPNFQKDAIPTPRGWTHPKTGELLVSRSIDPNDIIEYMGGQSPAPAPKPKPAPAPIIEPIIEIVEQEPEQVMLTEADPEEVEVEVDQDAWNDMTKRELEALGREHGIELDRRERKTTLIERLKNVIS